MIGKEFQRRIWRSVSLSLVAMIIVVLASLWVGPTVGRASAAYPTPTPTPIATPGASSCHVVYRVVAQFFSGFTTDITISNTGSTDINGWMLQFTFPDGQQLQSHFNGIYTQTGADVTMKNTAWNGTIRAGTTLFSHLGFVATWNNVTNDPPAAFALNGILCSSESSNSAW